MKKLIGILFIAGAIIVNIPYAILIATFDYPDILRQAVSVVLAKFADGGSGLIVTWLFFALSGIPLLIAVILLGKLWKQSSPALTALATTFGIIGLIAQLIGLLRWVFIVPVIATAYTAPDASEAVRQSAMLVFQAVHQFGGVLLGEYVGQLFTIGWMLLLSIHILRSRILHAWLGWFGVLASIIYLLGQTELLHTVIPAITAIDIAGFLGSILWLIWMICLGILLLLKRD